MAEDQPIACSLGAGELQSRLDEIAALGAGHLIEQGLDGDRHLLRFRASPEARRRLESIVAAESKCCPFLELSLGEMDGELLLAIGAPKDGQPVAHELAAAFGRDAT